MKYGTVFQFFVDKSTVLIGTALGNGFPDIGTVIVFLNRIFLIRIRQIQMELAFHKIPERLVAADILYFVHVAVDFHDTHRNRIKSILCYAVVYVGQEGKIVEIDPSHCVIIAGLLRIFKAVLSIYFVFLKNLVSRRGLHKIVTLQFRAADFLKETDLICCFHALTNSIDPQGNGHLHHLSEDDFPVFPFIKPPHKPHVKFNQIKLHALQNIQ